MQTIDTFTAVRACSVALLAGVVLHASDVTAGNGAVIDWRTVRSGEFVQSGADAFDTAQLLVALVGPAAALGAVERHEVEEVPPEPPTVPRVHAYMVQANGGRLRSFDVGGFKVMVDAHEDDAAQAEFTARLAAMCVA